jgi:hypothetical protein
LAILGYHLYIVSEHSKIPASLINRLRIAREFPGARYEIQIAAAMVAAGYSIDWVDDSLDGKRVEFIATHHQTKARFAVEAKSRHRPEVLASGVDAASDVPERADLQTLISRALQKDPELPLVIFIDVNMPNTFDQVHSALEHEIDTAWRKRIDRKQWDAKGGFPCVGRFVTNDTTPWRVNQENHVIGYPNWVRSYTGPSRHELHFAPYAEEIVARFAKVGGISDLNWNNLNRKIIRP